MTTKVHDAASARPGRGHCVVLPGLLALACLGGFGLLAAQVHGGGTLAFDRPLLDLMHAWSSPGRDRLALLLDKLGYQFGVVPLDIVLVLALLLWRKWREGLFAGLALGGAALLNVAAKQVFDRARPELWPSLAPETSFSFPSGHAMGSASLGVVLVLLAWPTRWRWTVLACAAGFALLVGASRIYLGVHYPSDILAGWSLALAWTLAAYALLYRDGRKPGQR